MLFSREFTAAAPQDALTEAQQNADRLAAALAQAESDATHARIAYDHSLHQYLLGGKTGDEPLVEPQRVLAGRIESLKRLSAEARERLARLTTEAENAKRLDSIRASGSRVAGLVGIAEQKLAAFQASAFAARQAEVELYAALFDWNSGLKQHFGVAQKDADFARSRIRHQAITIAKQSRCLIDCRFETDGEVHLGELERAFYAAQ